MPSVAHQRNNPSAFYNETLTKRDAPVPAPGASRQCAAGLAHSHARKQVRISLLTSKHLKHMITFRGSAPTPTPRCAAVMRSGQGADHTGRPSGPGRRATAKPTRNICWMPTPRMPPRPRNTACVQHSRVGYSVIGLPPPMMTSKPKSVNLAISLYALHCKSVRLRLARHLKALLWMTARQKINGVPPLNFLCCNFCLLCNETRSRAACLAVLHRSGHQRGQAAAAARRMHHLR